MCFLIAGYLGLVCLLVLGWGALCGGVLVMWLGCWFDVVVCCWWLELLLLVVGLM